MYVYISIYVYTVRYRQRNFFSFRTKESIYMSICLCVVCHFHGVTILYPSFLFAVDNSALCFRSCFMCINNLMFSYLMCLRCSIFSYLGRNDAEKRLCGRPAEQPVTSARPRHVVVLTSRWETGRTPELVIYFLIY